MFTEKTSALLFCIIGFLYLFIIIQVWWFRNKPHIQNRSPNLILMINFGVFIDSILKMANASLPLEDVDSKCQLALIRRVIAHYLAFVFILIRIHRVDKVK